MINFMLSDILIICEILKYQRSHYQHLTVKTKYRKFLQNSARITKKKV